MTRLYTTVNGRDYVDVPTEQILRYEHDDTPSPARAAPATADVLQLVNNASDKHQLDADFIQSVIRAESGFNVRAVSPKGARGLMQLMPGTASKLGVRDSFDPAQNIEGGTRYLRELLQEYNNDMIKALAAYNAGPHRVEQYRGVPPYRETHAYVARIVRDFNAKKLAQRRAQKLAQNKQRAGVQASAASTARAAP
jgi:soluble lytic murein transglycosylase-like protein